MSNAILKQADRSNPVSESVQEQEVFTIREAAEFLRVGRKLIDAAIRQRRIKVIQLTRSRRALRIYKADLLELRGFVR